MPLQKCISSSGMKCAFSIYKFLTRASLLVCEFYLAIDHWEQLNSSFEKSKCCRSSPFGNQWLAILKPMKVITVYYLEQHHDVLSNEENENEEILNSNDFYLA